MAHGVNWLFLNFWIEIFFRKTNHDSGIELIKSKFYGQNYGFMKCENPNSQYIEFKWNLISNCDWNNRQLFLTKKTLKISKKKSSRIPSVSTKRWDPRRSQLFFFSADMSRSRLDSCETKFGNCATSRSAGAMIWMNCQKKPKHRTKTAQIDLTDLTLLFHRRSDGVVPHTHVITKTRRGRIKMKTATPLHAGIVDVLCGALFFFPVVVVVVLMNVLYLHFSIT